jgi:hypothetical protein
MRRESGLSGIKNDDFVFYLNKHLGFFHLSLSFSSYEILILYAFD